MELKVEEQNLALFRQLIDCSRNSRAAGCLEQIDCQLGRFLILGVHDGAQGSGFHNSATRNSTRVQDVGDCADRTSLFAALREDVAQHTPDAEYTAPSTITRKRRDLLYSFAVVDEQNTSILCAT